MSSASSTNQVHPDHRRRAARRRARSRARCMRPAHASSFIIDPRPRPRRASPRSSTAARPGSAALVGADLLHDGAPDQLVAAARRAFRPPGRADQQCVDVLSDAGRQDHPGAAGTISLGSNLRAPLFLAQAAAPHLARAARTHHQHHRHSRLAAPEGISGVQHRQGGPRDAHALARARARPRDTRERHRAGSRALGRARHGRAHEARDRRANRAQAHRAARRTSPAPPCSSRAMHPTSPGKSSRSTAGAASKARGGAASLIQRSRGHARCREHGVALDRDTDILRSCAPRRACSA